MQDLKLRIKAIFGIGNPGIKYKSTRHNVGIQVIDKLADYYDLDFRLQRNWLVGKTEEYIIVKPIAYVNESGFVAKDVIYKYNILPEDFLVVVDDFALPLGLTRLRRKGSSGGHKGLESIIYNLQTNEFPRLRIGIGQPEKDAVDFVLSKFKRNEFKPLNEAMDRAVQVINLFIKDELDKAIALCNKKELD